MDFKVSVVKMSSELYQLEQIQSNNRSLFCEGNQISNRELKESQERLEAGVWTAEMKNKNWLSNS